jgi:hypothetical protein
MQWIASRRVIEVEKITATIKQWWAKLTGKSGSTNKKR